tara:strand:+ start:194 stop:322 length:129 start_codon:yes stop_codon:yes gene_type:complete
LILEAQNTNVMIIRAIIQSFFEPFSTTEMKSSLQIFAGSFFI